MSIKIILPVVQGLLNGKKYIYKQQSHCPVTTKFSEV